MAGKNVLRSGWEDQRIQGKSWAVVMGLNKESNFRKCSNGGMVVKTNCGMVVCSGISLS